MKRDERSSINELNSAMSKDQPTDCDGTPLKYGDEIVCVEPFTCEDGLDWFIGEEEIHRSQRIIDSEKIHKTEFTPSELKNFRKL